MHIKYKFISTVFLSAFMFMLSFGSGNVSAQTVFQFNTNLYWNMSSTSHPDVVQLQQFLTAQGFYSGPITGKYLTQTYDAVVKFQTAKGIVPASGYFGPSSRVVANQILLGGVQAIPTATVTNTVSKIATVSTSLTANVISSTTSGGNLILNPSLETVNGVKPLNWQYGKYGTNTSVFNYPVTGVDGANGANITMTAYTSGDAKWFFDDVVVTAGKQYTFSEKYKTNANTNVTIRWKKSNGTFVYQSLGYPALSTTWTTRTSTITVPADVVAMTIFHAVKGVGTLDIDDYKLVSSTSVVTTTTTPTPTATTTQTMPKPTATTTPVVQATSTTPATPVVNGLNFAKKEWGAYVGWQETAMDTFESAIGKTAQYRAVFIHWGNEKNFPGYLKPYVNDKNKTLVVFWEATNYNVGTVSQPAYNYDSVINGNWDAYFTQFAADAKAYGGPVVLIPFSEMNGDWFPWSITQNGNSPQKHIDAWRRMRGFFKDVPNVKFGWAPNHDSVPDTTVNQFENFYPGDAYVDYVGLDGFNFGSPWMTFDQVFGKPLARMKVYNKPVFIFSFASAAGVSKPAWITDALTVQMAKYPEIKGWIWFNESKERDWRVNVDSASLNAFKLALP